MHGTARFGSVRFDSARNGSARFAFPLRAPSIVPIMHQVSSTMKSITLSWPQPEQPNGIILDYELRYYEKELSEVNSTQVRSQTNTARVDGLRPGTMYVMQRK
ncbi:hypothetical protein PO909_031430 [Leuciscus waleckii]